MKRYDLTASDNLQRDRGTEMAMLVMWESRCASAVSHACSLVLALLA